MWGQLMSRIAVFQKLSLLFLVISLAACTRERPVSYVIVAVDQLSFADSSCSQDRSGRNSGLQILCNESVKWTHAYTTSVLSGPALSSIMTGLHPIDSGYRDPSQFLSPKIETIGKAAHRRGLRTLFLSGGPPILKKIGLGHGFENFEDFLNINHSPWLRTFRKNSQVFFDWLEQVDADEPFLTVFYVPDLRFLNRPLVNSFGDPLEKSFDSQFEEFDSALYDLIQKIKKRGDWDQTHFLLVGLQGRNLYDRKVINPSTNLHSESTQVGFFWKPTQNKRDAPVSWTMDKNISLADVGASLMQSLGASLPSSRLETASLLLSLKKPDSTFSQNRLHLIESAWGQWQLGTDIQYAMIADEELYLHSNPPQVFRTLTDRLETNPLSGTIAQNSIQTFQKISEELSLPAFVPPKISALSRWNFTYWDWMSEQMNAIKSATSTTPWEEIPEGLRPWTARALIETSDWKSLKSAAETWKIPYLLWLAHKQLNLPLITQDPCLMLTLDTVENKNLSKDCHDITFLEVVAASVAENKQRRWEKLLEEQMIRTSILRMNRALGGVWDVDEKMESVISRVEVFFRTSEHRALFRNVQRRVRSIELQSAQPERL